MYVFILKFGEKIKPIALQNRFFLAQINGLFQLQIFAGELSGFVTYIALRILYVICFSILFIIDTISTLRKKIC